MRPRSAEVKGDARIAVVGAATVEGERIRIALAARGVPGGCVDLFGATRDEVVLSEYAGEARIVQEAAPEAIAGHDLVFLCERDEAVVRALEAPPCKAVVVSLEVSGGDEPLVHAELRPLPVGESGRFFAIPHALSTTVAELLAPLERRFGVAEVVAVVIRPASDFGSPGIEELREQTVSLLRFERPPTEVFGRQLAFNLIPQALVQRGGRSVEERIGTEVAELLGWPAPRLALRLLAAPIFYGHGISIRVALGRPATAAEVAAAYEEVRGLRPPSSARAGTPLETSEVRETTVAEVLEDGLGGFWLWAVAAEAAAAAAEQAAEVAHRFVDRR